MRYAQALALLPALALAACATLPDYDALHRNTPRSTRPVVVGAKGLLTPAQSQVVLDRLKQQGDSTLLQRHLAFMDAISSTPLVTGNAAYLLIDGPAAMGAMSAAIASARNNINLEMYIFQDDDYGKQLAAQLIAKQAEGVQVNLIYDSLGSGMTASGFFESFRKNGIRVCEYNPLNPLKSKRSGPTQRDHRKLLVVDGMVAFTGGINISSEYSRSSFSLKKRKPRFDKTREGWRDTQIEIRGPAVSEFQELFFNTWNKQNCPAVDRRSYFPKPKVEGDKVVRVVATSPDDAENLIYLELLSAIHHAEHSVDITMAYFVPDKAMIRALTDAARRGVAVRLILPSATWLSIVFNAGRSHYSELLDAGVHIYERQSAPLHAKTIVIDGIWSTVGSANMDWLSFLHNDEINAVVLSEEFALQMEQMFSADLTQSNEVSPKSWKRRGLWPRLKEAGSRMLEYWL